VPYHSADMLRSSVFLADNCVFSDAEQPLNLLLDREEILIYYIS